MSINYTGYSLYINSKMLILIVSNYCINSKYSMFNINLLSIILNKSRLAREIL